MRVPSSPISAQVTSNTVNIPLSIEPKRMRFYMDASGTASIVFAKARDNNNRSLSLSYKIPMLISDETTKFMIKSCKELISENQFDRDSIKAVKRAMFNYASKEIMASNNGQKLLKTLHTPI